MEIKLGNSSLDYVHGQNVEFPAISRDSWNIKEKI